MGHCIPKTLIIAAAIGCAEFILPSHAIAEELTEILRNYKAQTALNGNALSDVRGVINLNMAAGGDNLQSNSGVIALGAHTTANNSVIQSANTNDDFALGKASVSIQKRAFNNAVGWISVNQTAGQSNVQSNTMGVVLGIEDSSLSDAGLGQVLSGKQELNGNLGNHGATQRELEIDSTAFSGAHGLIQVNQSAGTGNSTHNRFSLRMAGTGG